MRDVSAHEWTGPTRLLKWQGSDQNAATPGRWIVRLGATVVTHHHVLIGAGTPCALPLFATAARAYSSNTETTFVSDPDAPLASVTVAVIVKLRGRMMT